MSVVFDTCDTEERFSLHIAISRAINPLKNEPDTSIVNQELVLSERCKAILDACVQFKKIWFSKLEVNALSGFHTRMTCDFSKQERDFVYLENTQFGNGEFSALRGNLVTAAITLQFLKSALQLVRAAMLQFALELDSPAEIFRVLTNWNNVGAQEFAALLQKFLDEKVGPVLPGNPKVRAAALEAFCTHEQVSSEQLTGVAQKLKITVRELCAVLINSYAWVMQFAWNNFTARILFVVLSGNPLYIKKSDFRVALKQDGQVKRMFGMFSTEDAVPDLNHTVQAGLEPYSLQGIVIIYLAIASGIRAAHNLIF